MSRFVYQCLIGIALLGSGWGDAVAQLNESDTTRFQVRAALTGIYQRGNVDYLALRGNLAMTVRLSDALAFKTQNTSLYQEFFERKADNDLDSRNFWYYRPQRWVYPFAMGFLATNFRRKLDFRYFVGSGVTGQVIRRPQHVLKLSAALVHEVSEFSDQTFNYEEYTGEPQISVWRATFYAAGWHDLFNNTMRLYYTIYGQPSLSDQHNYRIHLDVGADVKIGQGISCSVLYSFSRENVVVEGIQQDDALLTLGFSYTFKTEHKKGSL